MSGTTRTINSLLHLGMLFALTLLTGCGSYPPIVEDAGDIRKLPADQKYVRARGLSDGDLPALEHLQGLYHLDFMGGRAVKEAKITDRGLETLSKISLPNLGYLMLGYNKNVSDDGLSFVAEMSGLEWVSLAACPKVTDDGLAYMAKHKTLEGLDLRGCLGITDVGLAHLTSMTALKRLHLGGCPNISSAAVDAAITAMPWALITKDEEKWAYQNRKR